MSISPLSNSGVNPLPPKPLGDIVQKAEDTVRRTNLQAAAKTPAGAALAAAKYIATDVIKENFISPELSKSVPGAIYLNSKAAAGIYNHK